MIKTRLSNGLMTACYICSLLFFTLLTPISADGVVYKHIDSDGRITFSDKRPVKSNVKSEKLYDSTSGSSSHPGTVFEGTWFKIDDFTLLDFKYKNGSTGPGFACTFHNLLNDSEMDRYSLEVSILDDNKNFLGSATEYFPEIPKGGSYKVKSAFYKNSNGYSPSGVYQVLMKLKHDNGHAYKKEFMYRP